ncbi:MAG: response regulator transcription factor [Chloroflexi bacterium]|nr:response regulator transcription factor [Chloroflexota bacterium]
MDAHAESGRILVVDDEPQIRRALRLALRTRGYSVLEAATGEEALDLAAAELPDALILDLGLPDLDGVEVCQRLREWTRVPVVMLTVVDDDEAKVRALDAGADDYITKPFSIPELLARLRAVRRRAEAPAPDGESTVVAGDLRVDLARRVVTRGSLEVHLTPTEYGLLRHLVRHPNRVITHGQLLQEVLGTGYGDATGALRVYMAALRKKLEADPGEPRHFVTEPGVGYRFRTE